MRLKFDMVKKGQCICNALTVIACVTVIYCQIWKRGIQVTKTTALKKYAA